ncbi:MAG: hypothetical protein IIA49_06085 [Bacteroidetes bacterium]|nr:hypothetical protein [Bacteroidota bacterium]
MIINFPVEYIHSLIFPKLVYYSSKIAICLESDFKVNLSVCNLVGEKVSVLVNETAEAGFY